MSEQAEPVPAANTTTVVMTRNRWPDLRRTLPRHPGPVVVVDNGSTDGSADLVAESFPEVTLLRMGRNLGAVARNVGVRRAGTPYVAFADDDSWWEPGALNRAERHFESSPSLGLLAARVLVGDDAVLDPVSRAQAASPLPRVNGLPGPSVLGFLACGAIVRRQAFLDAGGFDEVVEMYGEEQRLAWDLRREGWQLAYAADVVAHHHPSAAPRPARITARLHRNLLLTAAMRRPWPSVSRTARSCLHSPEGRVGLALAIPRLPAALTRRRALPAHVEAEIRTLERAGIPPGYEAP